MLLVQPGPFLSFSVAASGIFGVFAGEKPLPSTSENGFCMLGAQFGCTLRCVVNLYSCTVQAESMAEISGLDCGMTKLLLHTHLGGASLLSRSLSISFPLSLLLCPSSTSFSSLAHFIRIFRCHLVSPICKFPSRAGGPFPLILPPPYLLKF